MRARILRRFARARSGVSAVEFALILPLMILLYAGSVELSEALAVDRKVNRVASTVGDLVAQNDSITQTQLNDIFAASSAIVEPYPTTTLKIMVMAVAISNTNPKQSIAWVKVNDGSTPPTTPVTVPDSIAKVGSHIIVAQVSYNFTSPFSSFMKGITGKESYSLNHTFMMRPRVSEQVTWK